jgi:hypothetical protein
VSYIQVDPQGLSHVATELTQSLAVIDEVEHKRDALKALVSDAGNANVQDAAGEFLDKWAYGVSCLKKDAETLAQYLSQASALYIKTENAIALAAAAGLGKKP